MQLRKKTLEKLRDLINEETEYRSGPRIVAFFNELGFSDRYGPGFPSRWQYTDERLEQINGTPELDKAIKLLFDPINFVGRFSELDQHIESFNQFMVFDLWQVERNNEEITFRKSGKIDIPQTGKAAVTEDDFLKLDFKEISISKLGLRPELTQVLEERLEEIRNCLAGSAPLAVIFLCGSTMEGLLLGIASLRPRDFNQAKGSPKDSSGNVRKFQDWTLSNFIDVAHEVGILKEDVKKFSHSLRDFRNYIHPFQQTLSQFSPDIHTSKISWQVLKAAIHQMGGGT